MTLTQSIAVRRSMRARSFFSKPLLTAAIVVIVVIDSPS